MTIKAKTVGVRDKIVMLLRKKHLETWTIDDLAELGISKKSIGNAHYHMSRAGLIVNTGKVVNRQSIWTWATQTPNFVMVTEDPSYHTIGKEIVAILRQQDEQIRSDTQAIQELTQQVADLQVNNRNLTERINSITQGRITTAELSEMNRRSMQ